MRDSSVSDCGPRWTDSINIMIAVKQFSSENLLMSVSGHLLLVAIMVTSFAVMAERTRNIASDHVQIMEIDLNAVKVSGDETRLYNTSTPAPVADDVKPEPVVPVAPDKPAPAPEPVDEAPLDAPSLIEDKEPTPEKTKPENEDKTPEQKPAAPQPETPTAPKKKTVVRVNREVVSLDRTLTISVVDALRVAMTRCWTIDTTRPDIAGMRAVAHLTMRQNGTVRDVWFESAARADTDPAFAYVLDTIRSAINVCQPFKMLPANEFSKWEKIQLTFYPTSGKVM